MVSSIRREEDETALVRPSNFASPQLSGSTGSTTMQRRPLESSAAASARPISPPPRMMTSDRVMEAAVTPETWPWREHISILLANAPHWLRAMLDPRVQQGALYAKHLPGEDNGDRRRAGPQAGPGARLEGKAPRFRAAAGRAHGRHAAGVGQPGAGRCASHARRRRPQFQHG